jgi:hypothetical protein
MQNIQLEETKGLKNALKKVSSHKRYEEKYVQLGTKEKPYNGPKGSVKFKI